MDDLGKLVVAKHRELSILGDIKDIIKSKNCSVLHFQELRGTIRYYKLML